MMEIEERTGSIDETKSSVYAAKSQFYCEGQERGILIV